MEQALNNKVRRRFDASAAQYDRHALLHRQIADRLLVRITEGPVPCAVLDIGCGTGHLTKGLKDRFPSSRVVGLDFSEGMIEAARLKDRQVDWVVADSHCLPFADGIFDLVTSNLAYQWAVDLTVAFREARRVLRPGGIFAATLFGYKTCKELIESLLQAEAGRFRFDRLPHQGQVINALAAGGFRGPVVDSQEMKTTFKDMRQLMSWLKAIGANNLLQDGYLGAGALSRAAGLYQEKFSHPQGIEATFEVIWVYAEK
jgi:malonyl-CoA O-methyltransferase